MALAPERDSLTACLRLSSLGVVSRRTGSIAAARRAFHLHTLRGAMGTPVESPVRMRDVLDDLDCSTPMALKGTHAGDPGRTPEALHLDHVMFPNTAADHHCSTPQESRHRREDVSATAAPPEPVSTASPSPAPSFSPAISQATKRSRMNSHKQTNKQKTKQTTKQTTNQATKQPQ